MILRIDISDPKPPKPQTQPQKDPVDQYFNCVATCEIDDSECEDSCTDQLKQDDGIHS